MIAVDEDDLNRFTLALLQVEQEGKQFMARTAASYVASRCGLKPRPLLEYSDLLASSSSHDAQQAAVDKQSKGGIIVVGSYVPKTTAQLSHLLQHMDIEAIELPVATLIESRRKSKNFDFDSYKVVDELILSIVTKISNLLAQDKHVVLYTSREFYPNATIAETAFVSHSLTEIISRIKYHPTTGTESIQPAYIVSKGGITSHEVAQFSLGIESAVVLGQIEAGIPVWKASISEDEGQPQVQEQSTLTEQVERSVIPSSDMIYIVFPGNVGDDTMLSKVAMKLGVAAKEATNSPPPPSSSGSTKKLYKATSEQMLQTLHQAKVDRRAIAAFNICK